MEPSLADIATAVAWRHEMKLTDICKQTRSRKYTKPRQIAMFLSREMTDETLEDIGKYFGRHHTTVLWAIRRVQEASERSPNLAEYIRECREAVGQVTPC